MSEVNQQALNNEETKELQFRTIMSHLEVIDQEIANMVNNFNDGHGCLATLSFDNPDTALGISTRGFTYGPAYTTTVRENGQLKLVTDLKNPHFFVEDALLKEDLALEKEFFSTNDQEDESFEQFQKKMSGKKETEIGKNNEMKELAMESEEVDPAEILNRFGNINVPVSLHAARNSFNKMLKNIINIANEQAKLRAHAQKK